MSGKRIVLLTLFSFVILVLPVEAKTFFVNSAGDEADPNPSDDICGILADSRGGPSFGPCTLRAAIQTANANSTTDVIQFAIPASDPNCASNVCTINLGTALADLSSNLTISGPGAAQLIIRRSSSAATNFRIFNVTTAGAVTISGLTMTGGRLSNANGAGIQNLNAGTLTLTACTLDNNIILTSTGLGGGIYNHTTGLVTLSNSTLSSNSGVHGGAVCNFAAGTIMVSNSLFNANSADRFGGALYNANSAGVVALTSCTLTGSRSQFGGAIFNQGTLTAMGSTFSQNATQGKDFVANATSAFGGAIYNASGSALTLVNCTLSRNSASGGLGISGMPGGDGRGGAVFNEGASCKISNCTVSDNSVSDGTGSPSGQRIGGGVESTTGAVNVKSTLIAQNSATIGPDFKGAVNSAGFNLIGKSDGSTGFTAATDLAGTTSAPLDPKLDPTGLADQGGPTKTIRLLGGSPAIDKGASAGLTGNLPTDQRGFGRNGAADIGAFEFNGFHPGLANISTRLRVETGDNVLIGGFIVIGTQPKKVVLRAIGPSLPVAGRLANPTLELVGPGGTMATNDNWRSSQEADIVATTVPPSNDLESAIVATLPANNSSYTAIVRGVGGGTGVGLVEVYDLDRTVDSTLANISTRGLVQTGETVLIGGFIVANVGPQRVIIRAIGPSLPVGGKLADPTLEVVDQNGTTLATNDDWRSTQEAEIIATTVPPTDDREAAIVITLPAGAATTAIVRGKNNTTGVALVEVFALN